MATPVGGGGEPESAKGPVGLSPGERSKATAYGRGARSSATRGRGALLQSRRLQQVGKADPVQHLGPQPVENGKADIGGEGRLMILAFRPVISRQ